jgi:hypothetical protein
VAMGGNRLVHQGLEPHACQRGPSDGTLITTFCGQSQGLDHGARSLPLEPRIRPHTAGHVGGQRSPEDGWLCVERERPYHNFSNRSTFERTVRCNSLAHVIWSCPAPHPSAATPHDRRRSLPTKETHGRFLRNALLARTNT